MSEKVLETFVGTLHRIDEEDDIAFISIKDDENNEYIGQYSASKLKEKGINEDDRFTIKTIEVEEDLIRIDIELIPRRELTEEEMQKIRDDIREMLPELPESDGPFDDY